MIFYVRIEEECDGFVIHINDTRWRFDQEDTKEKLVEVFETLGCKTTYVEVY